MNQIEIDVTLGDAVVRDAWADCDALSKVLGLCAVPELSGSPDLLVDELASDWPGAESQEMR